MFQFFFFKHFIVIYFWPCWVLLLCSGFLQLHEWGLLFAEVHGCLTAWLPLLQSEGSRTLGLSNCGA